MMLGKTYDALIAAGAPEDKARDAAEERGSGAGMDPKQEEVRSWLRGVLERAGLTGHALEKRAKLGRGTLTRFLNQPVNHILSHRTMTQVAMAVGEPLPIQISDGTDVDVLRIALMDARQLLGPRCDPDYEQREAETVAHLYDVLMETLREGRDLDQARKTLQAHFRRAGSARETSRDRNRRQR